MVWEGRSRKAPPYPDFLPQICRFVGFAGALHCWSAQVATLTMNKPLFSTARDYGIPAIR